MCNFVFEDFCSFLVFLLSLQLYMLLWQELDSSNKQFTCGPTLFSSWPLVQLCPTV